MLYALVLIVIVFAILLIYIVRKVSYAIRSRRASASSGLPSTTQDLGGPVTFRGVARDVTNRVFVPRELRTAGDPEEGQYLGRRSMNSDYYGHGHGYDYRYDHAPVAGNRGVNREVNEGEVSDPELPSYGDTRGTMPLRPAPIYDPASSRPQLSGTDAPPKYVRSGNSISAPPQQPIVTTV